MKDDKSSPHQTILVLVAALLIIYFIYAGPYFLYVALTLIVGTLISPSFAKLVHKLWMGLANILGQFFPKIILSLLFFLILFPISLLAKLGRKKRVLHLDPQATTTWVRRKDNQTKINFNNPW